MGRLAKIDDRKPQYRLARCLCAGLRGGKDGTSALEFAVLCPVVAMMLFGIIDYGGCFWMSHSLQQLANDAARSTVGGLSATERTSLAQATLSSELPTYGNLTAPQLAMQETETGQTVTITINYNASTSVFWALQDMVPMPSSTLVRQASVQMGGF